MKKLQIPISDQLMTELKLHAVKNKTTLKEFVTAALQQYISSSTNTTTSTTSTSNRSTTTSTSTTNKKPIIKHFIDDDGIPGSYVDESPPLPLPTFEEIYGLPQPEVEEDEVEAMLKKAGLK